MNYFKCMECDLRLVVVWNGGIGSVVFMQEILDLESSVVLKP